MYFFEKAHLCDPPPEPTPLECGGRLRDAGAPATFCDCDFWIDWEKAAPSWSAIWCGAILPMVGSLAAIVAICLGLSR